MRLHYGGTYNLNPDSLPHGEHMPGAVPFREIQSTKALALLANGLCVVLTLLFGLLAFLRIRAYSLSGGSSHPAGVAAGCLASVATLVPHELLHAVCFREDVSLYINLRQGMLFVAGPETMSRGRFVLMSLLPNLAFGAVPYLIGMLFPSLPFFLALGTLAIGMGAGDYYNVFNALTQMPKGARTYLYKFNSYWYIPKSPA